MTLSWLLLLVVVLTNDKGPESKLHGAADIWSNPRPGLLSNHFKGLWAETAQMMSSIRQSLSIGLWAKYLNPPSSILLHTYKQLAAVS